MTLTDAGIDVQASGTDALWSLRGAISIPWAEVADVRAPGRWDEHASIRLPHRGQLRRTTLLGMPEPDARRLAEAFAQWRATSGHPFRGSRSR